MVVPSPDGLGTYLSEPQEVEDAVSIVSFFLKDSVAILSVWAHSG